MELEGKVALVTGATGGIGAAVARKLHEVPLTRPRRLRILTTSFRPISEASRG